MLEKKELHTFIEIEFSRNGRGKYVEFKLNNDILGIFTTKIDNIICNVKKLDAKHRKTNKEAISNIFLFQIHVK